MWIIMRFSWTCWIFISYSRACSFSSNNPKYSIFTVGYYLFALQVNGNGKKKPTPWISNYDNFIIPAAVTFFFRWYSKPKMCTTLTCITLNRQMSLTSGAFLLTKQFKCIHIAPDMNTHPHTYQQFAFIRGAQHVLNASDTAFALRSNWIIMFTVRYA